MDTAELKKEAIALRKEKHQMIKTALNADMKNGHDLAIVYTPGVSAPCLEIKKDEDLSLELTWRGNVVAVISDGTRVLGLGDIGAAAAMPVMEGKSALYKRFGNIDADKTGTPGQQYPVFHTLALISAHLPTRQTHVRGIPIRALVSTGPHRT